MIKTIALKVEMKIVVAILLSLVLSLFLFTRVTHAATFTQDLKEGSEGADVMNLQAFLEAKGFLIMPQGVAKGFYGPRTRMALAKYQESVNINPAVGYFGPMTRAKIGEVTLVGTANNGTVSLQGTAKNGTTVVDPTLPVVNKITVIDATNVIINGTGFSTSLDAGKTNTVTLANILGTKQIVITPAPTNSSTQISVKVPPEWFRGEQPVAWVRNDATQKVSPIYPPVSFSTTGGYRGSTSGGSTSGGGSGGSSGGSGGGGCVSCGSNNSVPI